MSAVHTFEMNCCSSASQPDPEGSAGSHGRTGGPSAARRSAVSSSTEAALLGATPLPPAFFGRARLADAIAGASSSSATMSTIAAAPLPAPARGAIPSAAGRMRYRPGGRKLPQARICRSRTPKNGRAALLRRGCCGDASSRPPKSRQVRMRLPGSCSGAAALIVLAPLSGGRQPLGVSLRGPNWHSWSSHTARPCCCTCCCC